MPKNKTILLTQLGGFNYRRDDTIHIEAPLTPPLSLGYLKDYSLIKNPSFHIQILEPWAITNNSPEEIGHHVLSYSPKITGFSCYVWNIELTKQVIKYIKKRDPSIKVIVGGPEVYNLNHFQNESSFDIGVLGEGEEIFHNVTTRIFLEQSITGIPGTFLPSDKKNARKERTSQLRPEDIPTPYADNIFKLDHYKHLYMETVRGCSFRCIYCYYHKQVPQISFFPLEHVKNEIQAAIQNNIKYVIFIDSVLNLPNWGEKVCQLLSYINKNKSLELSADIHAELITEDFCCNAKEANFTEFQVGLQSINPLALKNINRKLNINHFAKGMELLNQYEIPVNVDLIFGLPGDTIENIWEGIEFIQRFDIRSIRVALLRVLPGTDLWKRYHNFKLEFDEQVPYFIKCTDKISEKEIYDFFKGENHRVF